jgi:hypothetical protein
MHVKLRVRRVRFRRSLLVRDCPGMLAWTVRIFSRVYQAIRL